MRMLRKAVLTAVVMLLVAAGVYAESYAGFEVKEGLGGTKVIVLRLSEDYSDPTAGKYEVEFPVEYYKDLENELKIIDNYMSMNEEIVRTSFGDSEMIELMTKCDEILKAKKNYLTENNNIAISFMKNVENAMNGSINCLMMIKRGATFLMIGNALTKNEKNVFCSIMEAFPAIEFKNLGLKL
ncbi:MAG: hypothetical protein K5751_07875 [Treponemataceae bacterium]|nr:hypothetical protein [Treponemataceae bacterium]